MAVFMVWEEAQSTGQAYQWSTELEIGQAIKASFTDNNRREEVNAV